MDIVLQDVGMPDICWMLQENVGIFSEKLTQVLLLGGGNVRRRGGQLGAGWGRGGRGWILDPDRQ